jgi:acetate---CoA ligase (ADP-forming)
MSFPWPTASLANPVDLVGDADAGRYSRALHGLGPDAADAALIVLTAQAATDSAGVARAVIGATRGWPIPVVAALVGGARATAGARALEEAGIPCYEFPEPAVRTVAGMALVAERRGAPEPAPAVPPSRAASTWLRGLRERGVTQLGFAELTPLFAAYGIRCAAGQVATDAAPAAAAAERVGFPVALKVLSPNISHKSEVGGVVLRLSDGVAVKTAAAAMLERVATARPGARVEGVLVQPMVTDGKELLVGLVRDAQFGPLVMVGFGGIYVEVRGDTATRLAPLPAEEAMVMLDELRMAPVLRGARGERPVDRAALADTIARFARIGVDLPELAEIEINPLMAGPDGAVAVDARARLDR